MVVAKKAWKPFKTKPPAVKYAAKLRARKKYNVRVKRTGSFMKAVGYRWQVIPIKKKKRRRR